MRRITKSFLETGADFNLSPEHWLSLETASKLTGNQLLGDIIHPITNQVIPDEGVQYVLDTGSAREGLIDVTIIGDPTSSRRSAKKIAREGDVIVSRLRPYLRQVALIPEGAAELLGQNEFYCSTEFFVLRRKNGLSGAGIVAWLLSEPIQAMMSEAATGGHHPRINLELLINAPIDDRYLDPEFESAVALILTTHLKVQCELRSLLRQ